MRAYPGLVELQRQPDHTLLISGVFILHYLRVTPESSLDVPSAEFSVKRCLETCLAVTDVHFFPVTNNVLSTDTDHSCPFWPIQLTVQLAQFDNNITSLRAARMTPFACLPPYALFSPSVVRPFLHSSVAYFNLPAF